MSELSNEERADLFAHVSFCVTAKQQMIKAGDRAASKKCPYCAGRWHFRLAGSRNHLHGACDGTCERSVME